MHYLTAFVVKLQGNVCIVHIEEVLVDLVSEETKDKYVRQYLYLNKQIIRSKCLSIQLMQLSPLGTM